MRLLAWLHRLGVRFVTPECNTWPARLTYQRKGRSG